MSFILDALRKSEQERQRNEQPGIASVRYQQRVSNRAVWIPLVIVLVVINISLLLFLLLKDNTPPLEADVQPTMQPGVVGQAPAVVASRRQQQPGPEIPTSSAAGNRRLADELAPEIQTAAATSQTAATPTPDRTKSTPAKKSPANPENYGNLPTLTELLLAGSIDLKPLHVDIHVYSAQPAERFVFVNTTKYREGDSMSEGPILREITEEGVVLSYQGREFIVTRE
jgi:general secretion pathway protein B